MPMKLTAAVVAAVLAAVCSPAGAQMRVIPTTMVCGLLEDLRKGVMGETPVARGPAGTQRRHIGEVWVNPKTGAWTFVLIIDGRIGCSVLGGYGGFKSIAQEIQGDPA